MSKPKAQPCDVADRQLAGQLLRAILASGRTAYDIAKEAGLAPGVVGRFVSGQRGLTLESAGKVAEALGLRLETVRGRGRPLKAPPRTPVEIVHASPVSTEDAPRETPEAIGEPLEAQVSANESPNVGSPIESHPTEAPSSDRT